MDGTKKTTTVYNEGGGLVSLEAKTDTWDGAKTSAGGKLRVAVRGRWKPVYNSRTGELIGWESRY